MSCYWLRVRRPRGDSGVALMITIAVMIVSMGLVTLVISLAIQENNSSARDRQRTVAVDAAEAGVDASYAMMQTSGTSLACTWPSSGASAVESSPDTATARSTITYFKADGTPLGHCLTSGDVTGPSSTFQALVDGYGVAQGPGGGTTSSNRHMQALVRLTPVYANSVDKAIFANGNLTFNNQTTLTGDGNGANADVYSNSNFVCSNNENFAGSIYTQGSFTVQGGCTVAGDVWARGDVANGSGSNGSIGGRVLSSSGSVTLPSNFNVNGTLLASGSISWSGCSVSGKCFANTSVAAPPAVPFPIMAGNSSAADAEWVAAGYTIFEATNCATVKSDIINVYAKKGSSTLVRTVCPVNFAGDKTIPLSNNLAIYAYGGISSSQQVNFTSSVSGQQRYLYWVVPYDAAPVRPCASPGVTTDNQFNFSTDVNMYIYSPCTISLSNNSSQIGQVYGGSDVSIQNKFTMQFIKVPVFGIDPTSTPVLSYKLDIVYKREMS